MSPSAEEPATVVACLTPSGTGALATLAICGPARGTWSAGFSAHTAAPPWASRNDAEPDRFWLGRFGPEPAEEVVVTLKRRAPVPGSRSTATAAGKSSVSSKKPCKGRGSGLVPGRSWRGLCRTLFRPPRLPRLPRPGPCATAAVLLDQHQGAFEQVVREMIHALERRRTSRQAAGCWTDSFVTPPWDVTSPNRGGWSWREPQRRQEQPRQRPGRVFACVVSATPGTTRDVVTTLIAVEGWPVELADTAGQRAEAETLEAQGIALAHGRPPSRPVLVGARHVRTAGMA